jgi:hypothetical protein
MSGHRVRRDGAGKAETLEAYANLAEAKCPDSMITAQRLQVAVQHLVAEPSAEALQGAKAAWLAARIPYQQTEVFRFGNAMVDDWDSAAGFYCAALAEDHELTEMLGGLADVEFADGSVVSLGVFFAGNTGKLNNALIQ